MASSAIVDGFGTLRRDEKIDTTEAKIQSVQYDQAVDKALKQQQGKMSVYVGSWYTFIW